MHLMIRKLSYFKPVSQLCIHNLASRKSSTFHGLENLKVLDLTRIVAGPYCTMILGDLGAQIFKVEAPTTGDEARNWPPNIGSPSDKISCYYASLNRNKKSICINLKCERGKEIIYDLAKICDVLVENYVPGKLDKMGLGYDQIKEIAPHLIYCSVTGYGSKGPYKDRPGYDVIAASVGGFLHITGPEGGDPCKAGVAVTDMATGLYAHGAILAALLQRTYTGKGQKIECNLLSTQVACLINIGANFLNAGKEGVRWGTAHESIVPYESFKTSDGYITVGTGSNAQFKDLCLKMNLPDIASSENYKTNALRVKNREPLIKLLKDCFIKKPTSQWMEIFDEASFPCGPVNNLSEDVRTVKMTLKKPKSEKQVKWTEETVDNENMNKKKSKCCCIYEKPKKFGESSSESEDECENCFGHVERKKKNRVKSTEQPPPDTSPPQPEDS